MIISIDSLYGQSVISSGGQSGTSNDLHASATIGETIIGSQNNGNLFSNQGFQQPLQSDITSVFEIDSKLEVQLSIGPIPTYSSIAIYIDKPLEGMFLLYDQLGKVVRKTPIKNQQLFFAMDLTQLDAATYYLTIVSPEGKKLTSVPIVKI